MKDLLPSFVSRLVETLFEVNVLAVIVAIVEPSVLMALTVMV